MKKSVLEVHKTVVEGDEFKTLGNLVWFQMRRLDEAPRLEIVNFIAQEGINPKLMPELPTPKKAFKEAHHLTNERVSDGKVAFLIRDVVHSTEDSTVEKQLIREERDSQGRTLSYTQVGKMALNLHTGDLLTRETNGGSTEVELKLQAFEKHFHERLNYISKEEIRKRVGKLFGEFCPVSVHINGAVNFVPKQFEKDLLDIQKLIRWVDRNWGWKSSIVTRAQVQIVPLLDRTDQREMVSEGLDMEVKIQLGTMLEKMKTYIQAKDTGEKVHGRSLTAVFDTVKKIRAKVALYKEFLQVETQGIDDSLGFLNKQALALLEDKKVKVAPKAKKSKEKTNDTETNNATTDDTETNDIPVESQV